MFSFRSKLLLAMMLVVVAVTAGILLATQKKVSSGYSRFFAAQSTAEAGFFNTLQEARLGQILERALTFHTLVRLREPIRAYQVALDKTNRADQAEVAGKLYLTTEDELRNLRGPDETNILKAAFFRMMDAQGDLIPPTAGTDAGLTLGLTRDSLPALLRLINRSWNSNDLQTAGIVSLETAKGWQLFEVVFTRIIDVAREDEPVGALVLGFPLHLPNHENKIVRTGVWMPPRLFSDEIPISLSSKLSTQLPAESAPLPDGSFELNDGETPHRLFYRPLKQSAGFPEAYLVTLFSMADSVRELRDLRWQILSFGLAGIVAALVASFLLAGGLTGPLRDLVRGTREISRGNYEVTVPVRTRDELGELSGAFNEMSAGLALKEKYRSVLDLVADPAVAEEMIRGKITLGGEIREVSILFCDIRGFTSLTQNMPPDQVVEMLNEHMTVLTRAVYENHGVVDKFVGDLIMAIFGAPKSYGNDPLNACRTARRMIDERARLNQVSQYKIEVGIGVASGSVLAGRMGSEDRLNYTVLGERVNLASRLCSKAGRSEVVIDQATREKLVSELEVEALAPLEVKGYSEAVSAFKLLSILQTPETKPPV